MRERDGAVAERVALVTGAAGGLGRAIAARLAGQGALVAVNDLGAERTLATVEELRAQGHRALAAPADLADAAAVEAAAAKVAERWGRIDTWINCAMLTVFAPVSQTTPDEYRRVTEVTYHGYVYGTRAALDRMLPRDHGTIVQVGSDPCRPPPVAPTTPSRASTRRSAASCCMTAARYGSPWCNSPRSTPRSSHGC